MGRPWITRGIAALTLCLLPALPALADQPFELDGNAVATSDVEGTDWDIVNEAGNSGLTEAETNLIADRPEPAGGIYNGGGSKDQIDINQWKWRSGSPPDKDDLTNAYAAAVRAENGNFVLVFGMDRYDTSGDAQLGFWFLQDDVKPVGSGTSGTFSGRHKVGDILVLVNFSNGGSVPTIEVYRWNGTTAQLLSAADAALCTDGWIPAGKDHCGITNPGSIAAPWSYVNKDVGPTNQFPRGAFFEGAIDLTMLGATACFTSFQAESRSSTSITAVLKDFANGGFPVCGIDVSKTCSNPRLNEAQDRIIYDITGKVTNSGFGTVFNVALSDNPEADGAFELVDCETNEPLNQQFPLASLSTEACYRNTITLTLEEKGSSDTVTATANTKSGDSTSALPAATATATCPGFEVSPKIKVTKDCKASVVVDQGRVTAKVKVSGLVCNKGDTKLSGVKVVDLGINTNPNPLIQLSTALPAAPLKAGSTTEREDPTVANGSCKAYEGTYFPSSATDQSGMPTTCAGDVIFKDTVEATAIDIFGKAVVPDTDVAECPLCTDCSTQ